MRMASSQRALGFDGGAVRADRYEWLFERVAHVFFRVVEINGRDRALIFNEQLEQHVKRWLSQRLDDFAHSLTLKLLVLWIPERHEQHPLPATCGGIVVVPV